MRNKVITEDYYLGQLGFERVSTVDYDDYVMLKKENIEIHFFKFKALNIKENYGQVYIRTSAIDDVYQSFLNNNVAIHPNGSLQTKAWGQREFSLLDPDNNLLTFGQKVYL
tara:strand:- start:105726 stop:106058 length:333 start_codon:yes stop_codon:yes gene_type:complete